MKDLKKYIAEFIGTFVLVLFACGVAGQFCAVDNSGVLMTALAFGLVIVAMAYSIGNVSGCHINPAVSIAMLVSKKISLKDFCGYIVAQFLGAIAGAAVLNFIVKDTSKLGCNALYNGSA
jgi:aquaporin Z